MKNFDRMYVSYAAVIRNYLFFQLKNSKGSLYEMATEQANILTNDVFCKIEKKYLDQAINLWNESDKRLENWLKKIARNQMIDFLRKQKDKNETTTRVEYIENLSIEESTYDFSIDEKVNKLFLSCDENTKDILHMFYIEGKKHKDIAEELNVKPNAVGMMLTRARKKAQIGYYNNFIQAA